MLIFEGFKSMKENNRRWTYNPNGRRQQTQLNARQIRVDAPNNDSRIRLRAVTHANHPKVHDDEWVDPPVDDDVPKILHRPQLATVHPRQVLVMDTCVFALQGRSAFWQPLHPATSLANFAWGQGSVGEPPEK